MNTVDDNAAVVTPATTSFQQPICSTPPIHEHQFEVAAPPTAEAVAPAPVLITEQEVVFSTAAAVPVRPVTIRWWSEVTSVVSAAMQRMFHSSTADGRPRQDYPRRYEFLEQSCMAREMQRL